MENVGLESIQLPESQKIDIVSISLRCKCKKCGWVWGVYLYKDGTTPPNFDTCRRCESLNKEL